MPKGIEWTQSRVRPHTHNHTCICTHTFTLIPAVMERSLTGIPPSVYQFMYSSLHFSSYSCLLESCLSIRCLYNTDAGQLLSFCISCFPHFMLYDLLDVKRTCLVIRFENILQGKYEGWKCSYRYECEGWNNNNWLLITILLGEVLL